LCTDAEQLADQRLARPSVPATVIRLELMTLMIGYAAVAIALAPLVIAAEAPVLARRHHRGEVIGPAPSRLSISQADGQP
jgi:hypothetical protein